MRSQVCRSVPFSNAASSANFRSPFVNTPGSSNKAIQIIPVGDIATKNDFERIENITRNDVIAAWRITRRLRE
jgi:hypothetical protein